MHVSLPAGAPAWAIGLSILGPVLAVLVYGLARLVRAALPDASADRLEWWRCYWQYRRELRQDQCERRRTPEDWAALERQEADNAASREDPQQLGGHSALARRGSRHQRLTGLSADGQLPDHNE